VLAHWGDAVRPYLAGSPLAVIDVGAGTGIFAAAWPSWTLASVLAVEPAAAMVQASSVDDPSVRFVRAVAEALPVQDERFDVVWVSTALHHFYDVDHGIAEFARVLRRGGRVLVRTYVPGRTEVTYVSEFPGRSKWMSRFHTETELLRLFAAHGFRLVAIREVLEWTESYAASAAWVARMRHADSMLTALSDEEVAEGLAALRADPHRVGRLELTLAVFERP
jgi:SAM-dependent methyltransferase